MVEGVVGGGEVVEGAVGRWLVGGGVEVVGGGRVGVRREEVVRALGQVCVK